MAFALQPARDQVDEIEVVVDDQDVQVRATLL
jgi:hypothetical protein